jgi:hypothetical protein
MGSMLGPAVILATVLIFAPVPATAREDAPPTVTLRPRDEPYGLYRSVALEVVASDDAGLDYLELEADGPDRGGNAMPRVDCEGRRQCSVGWTYVAVTPGRVRFTARAVDSAGQTAEVTAELELGD